MDMEYGNQIKNDYSFLEQSRVESCFSDLNIKLLSGRHIQDDEYQLYSVLTDYFDDWERFYSNLYRLHLIREVFDNRAYYYLDFFDGTKGALSDQSRYKQLTEWQTLVGLMLLDLYYVRYFEDPKQIKWSHIKQEIEAGDRKENLQTLFFGEVRNGFTKNEWSEVEKKWRNTINSFHDLGWVNKLSGQSDELRFEIRPAIHRLASLYVGEMMQLDEYVHLFKESLNP
ncbi:MAG: hypothetical protein EOO89_00295 [Pedobacter sp.]|nr:MAG: hypothetical protein EOO89_00295 [Pedobacter sp.]